MSPYLVAFVIPSKMTSCMVSCFEIPPHTRTVGRCLCLYFNYLSVFYFQKHFCQWYSSCTVDSSVKIRSSKASYSSIPVLHQSSLFALFSSQTTWQYLQGHCAALQQFWHLRNLLTRMLFKSDAVNSSFFCHLVIVALMVWRVVSIPSLARTRSSSINVAFSIDLNLLLM